MTCSPASPIEGHSYLLVSDQLIAQASNPACPRRCGPTPVRLFNASLTALLEVKFSFFYVCLSCCLSFSFRVFHTRKYSYLLVVDVLFLLCHPSVLSSLCVPAYSVTCSLRFSLAFCLFFLLICGPLGFWYESYNLLYASDTYVR